MFSWLSMIYSSEPSKVLVLSPVSSASILIIWFATLSEDCTPSSVKPKVKRSTTIASLLALFNTGALLVPKSNNRPSLSSSSNLSNNVLSNSSKSAVAVAVAVDVLLRSVKLCTSVELTKLIAVAEAFRK
jgi:hypothetical protein